MFLHRCRCTGSGCGKAWPSKASFYVSLYNLYYSVQYTLAHMLLHIGHCALIAVRTTTLFVLSTQYNTHLHMWHY